MCIRDRFPETEVLDYGVLGYGLDQAYLRYQSEGRRLAPHVVLIGCTPGVLDRCTSIYQPFGDDSVQYDPLTKPRFLPDGRGGLTFLPNPLRSRQDLERALRQRRPILEIGRHDDLYRPCVYQNPLFDFSATVRLLCWAGSKTYTNLVDDYRKYKGDQLNPASRAFRLGVTILERFAAEVKAAGAVPVVVLWAEPVSVARVLRGEPPTYQTLRDALDARGIAYLDTADAFRAAGTAGLQTWFLDAIHYSPAGNRVVAVWLGARLRERARESRRAILPQLATPTQPK
jgi:hypothetical protein